MIVEERMYWLHAHKVPEWLVIYEHQSLPILRRHLGKQFGYYVNEVGDQNLIVHQWAFESYADWETRRASLGSDPAWHAMRPIIRPYLNHQESRIMRPAAYFLPIMHAMVEGGQKYLADNGLIATPA
jgi:hypothetical protein